MSNDPYPEATAPPPRVSDAFVARWLDCLSISFGYDVSFPFAHVRTLLGRTVRICAPLLSYAHLDEGGARAACLRDGGEALQIRYLAPAPAAFFPNQPTQSMIPLQRWRDADRFLVEGLSANLRKKIRRAEKAGFQVRCGNGRPRVNEFYKLYLETMQRLGTPPFPRRLFETILSSFDAEIISVDQGDDTVVSYFVIYAGDIALFQWAGLRPEAGLASFLGEWAAVRAAIERTCRWFDLGRAAYDGGGFRHKAFWHPVLFAPAVLPSPSGSIYRKYRLASAAWRRMPAPVTSRLGPKLAAHLTDF